VIEQIMAEGVDIDLIELRSLKPLDMATIGASLRRTHKLAILDESTFSGGVGATVSAAISEALFYELDKPVRAGAAVWRLRAHARASGARGCAAGRRGLRSPRRAAA
jgi:pyruvate/2-oxoglutarate/acetoin dehydrogenase E1 component